MSMIETDKTKKNGNQNQQMNQEKNKKLFKKFHGKNETHR